MRYSQRRCSKLYMYVDSINVNVSCISYQVAHVHRIQSCRNQGALHWGDPPADFETSVYPIRTGGGGLLYNTLLLTHTPRF